MTAQHPADHKAHLVDIDGTGQVLQRRARACGDMPPLFGGASAHGDNPFDRIPAVTQQPGDQQQVLAGDEPGPVFLGRLAGMIDDAARVFGRIRTLHGMGDGGGDLLLCGHTVGPGHHDHPGGQALQHLNPVGEQVGPAGEVYGRFRLKRFAVIQTHDDGRRPALRVGIIAKRQGTQQRPQPACQQSIDQCPAFGLT